MLVTIYDAVLCEALWTLTSVSCIHDGCRDWAANHQNAQEHPDGYWINVEGNLPKEICGTYFRQG